MKKEILIIWACAAVNVLSIAIQVLRIKYGIPDDFTYGCLIANGFGAGWCSALAWSACLDEKLTRRYSGQR